MYLSIDRFKSHIPKGLHLSSGVWLGGGFFRSILAEEPVADYDVFFRNAYSVAPTQEALISEGYVVVFKCPEGKLTTLKNKDGIKIQLITEFFYPDMQACIDTFDLTPCRFISDGDSVLTYYSSVRDTLKKNINFNRVDFPVATMLRVAKYSRKGYKLTSKAATYFVELIHSRGVEGLELDSRVYID